MLYCSIISSKFSFFCSSLNFAMTKLFLIQSSTCSKYLKFLSIMILLPFRL